MPTDIIMPQMGESIVEGTITKWLKKPGDKVQRDEPLFEISTDKVDAEIPAPASGVLQEIKVTEGTTVGVNTVVGTIAVDGEAAKPTKPTTAKTASPVLSAGAPPAVEGASRPRTRGAAVMIIRGLARRQKAFRPRPSILRARLRRFRKRTALRAAAPIVRAERVYVLPTPPQPDGSVDLSYIEKVAREIADVLKDYLVIVDKSTVPVKTGEKVAETIKRYCKAKVDVDVVSNPEFLREGFAVEDFMKPDRIVVGVDRPEAEELMRKLYKPFLMNGHPIYIMDIPSAEMTKYAAKS